MQRKTIFPLFISGLLMINLSCNREEDGLNYTGDAVVSYDTFIPKLDQLILLLSLKIDDYYIVTPTVDSLYIQLNNNAWGVYQGPGHDTTGLKVQSYQGFWVSQQPVKYLVVADYTTQGINFTTAGEYADYLNQAAIEPGSYVGELKQMTIIGQDSAAVKLTPHLYFPFEVSEDDYSLYLGEYEIVVNP